jgi:hypothetical protein
MKVQKPITLHLPSLFVENLERCLTENKPKFQYNILYFHYLIYYLIDKKIRYKKYEYFAFNKQKLKQLTVSNIDRYIKYLTKYEFIISDKTIKKGVKSLWYKLNESYFKGVKKNVIPANSRLYSNIKKQRIKNETNISKTEPFLNAMFSQFKNLEFDYRNAEKWIYKNVCEKKQIYYLNSINQISDINLRYFKRNKTNKRLDTNLTNMSKDLRQFIKGDYVSIDLTNSQPFLLSRLIESIIKPNPYTLCSYLSNNKAVETFGAKRIQEILLIRNKKDFQLFKEQTLKGLLYDSFTKEYKSDISRKEVKDIMFKVLFSRNKIYYNYKRTIPYKEDKDIFKTVYPFVYTAIKILKENNNSILPIYLQKIESYIFIDSTAKELVQNGIIPHTVHDSVIVEAKHQEQALNVLKRVFEANFGVIPAFKTESLKKNVH